MSEQAPEGEPVVEPQQGDWLLASFVQGLNRMAAGGDDDAQVGVTMWVGGAMVSGFLVGCATYFRGLHETFREATGGSDSYDAMFEKLTTGVAEHDAEEHDDPIGFVHMREARTFVAGQQPVPANRGVWWRARIEQVDVFAFGVLGVERE
jgi:hypothetical protein